MPTDCIAVCSEKNTHSRFILWKMFRFMQNFQCRHSIEVKIKYSLLLLTRKHFIKCLSSTVKPIISQTCKNYVRITSSVAKNIYFFMSAEYLIPYKHTVKNLCKSKHFPRRYKRKREWVFFSEHSVLIIYTTIFRQRRECNGPVQNVL